MKNVDGTEITSKQLVLGITDKFYQKIDRFLPHPDKIKSEDEITLELIENAFNKFNKTWWHSTVKSELNVAVKDNKKIVDKELLKIQKTVKNWCKCYIKNK